MMAFADGAAPEFLPMSVQEMGRLGWDVLDVLIVTGDAYIDHPACGPALLGRWLVVHGYRVGIVAQPDWKMTRDIGRLGRPRLFAGVTAGALDSMLAHFTAFRKKRRDDAYTPGGKAGARPDRASIVYTNLVRQAFPGLPVVLGGIEASLRRATHYDFWSDKIRRSVLADSKADLIAYGMGERTVLALADRLKIVAEQGRKPEPRDIHGLPGTVFFGAREEIPEAADPIELPAHEDIVQSPRQLMDTALAMEEQIHQGRWAFQKVGNRHLIFAPPPEPLTTPELDVLYSLPYSRKPHPSYRDPVPAFDMIFSSLTSHRGCGGGCSFCSLALHQGRRVYSRSPESILAETERIVGHSGWKGSISDVGGPSANMWGARCKLQDKTCRRPSCLFPKICPEFEIDQGQYIGLLRSVRNVPGVKHVRVASGLRLDLGLADPRAMTDLFKEFVGGQLKIAPEHISDSVLRLMRKAPAKSFFDFIDLFYRVSKKAGKKQYVIPYLMSAFPGCTESDMKALSDWLKSRGWKPRQVQCFIPTPGTVATAMYYAGIDSKGKPIHVARSDRDRLRQHHLLVG